MKSAFLWVVNVGVNIVAKHREGMTSLADVSNGKMGSSVQCRY